MRLFSLFAAAMVAASITLTGCNSTAEKTDAPTAAEPTKASAGTSIEIYEADHDGRINVFYDQKTYESFLALGETSFRLTRIGAGPNGETVVFGLTKADKKKGADTPAALLWDGKLEATEFYGEMSKHGRIYVFSDKAEMDHVRALGHPSYMYTQIGAGPNGETVVYVLNKENKKKKPVDLIAKFESKHKK